MATNDNILSGDDLALLTREAASPTPEWTTAGAVMAYAPEYGGRYNQHYPRRKGVKPLALFRTRANLISPPAHVTDNTNDNVLYGTTALRFVGTSSYEFRSNLGGTSGVMPAIDVTNGSIQVWVKAGAGSFNNRGQLRIRIYSDGSPAAPSANYTEFDLGFMNGQLPIRSPDTSWSPFWQTFAVPGANALLTPDGGLNGVTKGGTGAVATAVTYATLTLSGTSTGLSMEIGDIQFVPNPRTKGMVILTIDDSPVSTFTGAAQILSRFGMPGVLFPGALALELGAANKTTINQMRTLQDVHGWQIGSGGFNHEDGALLQAMTKEQQSAWFSKLRAMHAALGFHGGMDFAYQTSISMDRPAIFDTIRQHFRSGRLYGGPAPSGQPVLHFGEGVGFSDPMRYRAVEFDSTRFNVANGYATQIKSFVDQAAANKGVAVFVTHDGFGTGKTQQLQNLLDMCTDINSRSDVEMGTVDDYFRSIS